MKSLFSFLNDASNASEFKAALSERGGFITFGNSGRRGGVKYFQIGLDNILQTLKDILTNLTEFKGLSEYEETPWRNHGSQYFSDPVANANSTVQTKPLFSTLSKVIIWANQPDLDEVNPDMHMCLEETAIKKTIYKLEEVANTFKPIKKALEREDSQKSHKDFIELLMAKKNLILTGAPGTGKTHLAKKIAMEITDGHEERIGFVQFHPSYDYTDFVEGLRPVDGGEFKRQDGVFKTFCIDAIRDSKISSADIDALKDALMRFKADLKELGTIDIKSFRSTAIIKASLNESEYITNVNIKSSWTVSDDLMMKYLAKKECHENDTYTKSIGDYIIDNYLQEKTLVKGDGAKNKYVFIIDEINRGELSKIFGELFFSIDPGYRGKAGKVTTQYQNLITDENDPFYEGFYIPDNVYIIGTMNDIDRGVEAMDFAIRRRFAWKEITAEQSAGNIGIIGEAKERMEALNNALTENGLTQAHHIGGAYFLKLINDDFNALWEYHLKGIISEYLRGEPDADIKLFAIKEAYDSVEKDDNLQVNTEEVIND